RPEGGGGYVPFEVVESSEELVAGQLAEAAVRPFDLAAQPPIRATVFELGDGLSVLLILLHHIATDGQSLRPLFDEMSTAYAARRDGRAPVWEPLPLQYADYALWQRAALGKRSDPDSALSRDLDFWTRALVDLPEELPLPLDRPRPAVAGQGGGAVPFAAEPQLRRDIAALARTHRCTPFMVLQAALAVTLTRLGAGTDIALGSPVAARGHPRSIRWWASSSTRWCFAPTPRATPRSPICSAGCAPPTWTPSRTRRRRSTWCWTRSIRSARWPGTRCSRSASRWRARPTPRPGRGWPGRTRGRPGSWTPGRRSSTSNSCCARRPAPIRMATARAATVQAPTHQAVPVTARRGWAARCCSAPTSSSSRRSSAWSPRIYGCCVRWWPTPGSR